MMPFAFPPAIINGRRDYIISNSVWMDGTNDHFTLTPTAGDRKKFTVSFWVYRTSLGLHRIVEAYSSGTDYTWIEFNASDQLEVSSYVGGASKINCVGDAVYRDLTGWMNVVVAFDIANTSVEAFVNGAPVTWGTDTVVNEDTYINAAVGHTIDVGNASWSGSGWVTHFAILNGVNSADGTEFGEFGALEPWNPIALTGMKHWLKMENSGTLGENSGSDSDWSAVSVTQSSMSPTDSVAQGVGCSAAISPLFVSVTLGISGTISNGNRTIAWNAASRGTVGSTIALKTGQKVFETVIDDNGAIAVGVMRHDGTSDFWDNSVVYNNSGSIQKYGAAVTSGLTSLSVNDVVRCEYDADAQELEFFVNDVSEHTVTGLSADYHTPGAACTSLAASGGCTFRFDSAEFTGTPTSGFTPWSTQNLTPVTDVLSNHYAAVEYTGDGVAIGSGGLAVTGFGFSPDYLHIKQTDRVDNHVIATSLMGAIKALYTNTSAAEVTNTEGVASFDTDGFTTGSWTNTNNSGTNHLAFGVKLPSTASGGTTGAGTAKTYSTIYNSTLGMSIITYTGNGAAGHTIPLPTINGKAPFMMSVKALDRVDSWRVYHEAYGGTEYLVLNATDAKALGSTNWNNTDPTSSVMTLGDNNAVNSLDEAYVAICYWETNLCKPISYTGNGAADGPFVYLHGLPVWWVAKCYSNAGTNWEMINALRDPRNEVTGVIYPNLTSVETATSGWDFCAVGGKIRAAGASRNLSGYTYCGVAFINPLGVAGRAQVRAR